MITTKTRKCVNGCGNTIAAPETTLYRGDWFQTYSGLAFYHQDPRAEDIRIGDIAHSLSLICRFGGHTKRFYSVAQHSVLVSRIVPPELALVGLLHDATEAYIGDMVHPLKKTMPEFEAVEDRIWVCIACKYSLPHRIDPRVKQADWTALSTERRDLMSDPPMPWNSVEKFPPLAETIVPASPWDAECVFLQRFRDLTQ